MRKTAQLCVRMTDDEIILLQELANKRSVRLSELVRTVLAEEAVTAAAEAASRGLSPRLAGVVYRAA